MCARDPLEVKGKGITGVGGAADKEAETAERNKLFLSGGALYFVARVSFPASVMPLVYTAYAFIFLLPAS
jgi:hypothetical protein